MVLALRRVEHGPSSEVRLLREFISDGRVAMLGPIRQELLSGVKTSTQFKKVLRIKLAPESY